MTAARRDFREQWQLSLPLALGHLAQNLMGMVDTAMLGRYSDTALAGAGIANSLLFAVTVFGMGAVMGMDTLVPQALGAGEPVRARRLLWHGIRLALLIGIPLTAVAALTPQLLPLAGVEETVAAEAAAYLYWRLPAIVPFLIFIALRAYLQALGFTRPIVVAMVVGNIANVAVDGALIFGDAGLESVGLPAIGLPALGAIGASIATTVVFTLCMLWLVGAVRKHPVEGARARDHEPGMTRKIFALGLPVGLQLVAEVGIFALTALLAGRMGKIPAAAHQVALTLASFTFSVVIGIGAATSVRVGRAVGLGDISGTRRAGVTGLGFGAAFMTLTAIVFLVTPEPLARLFTSDEAVIGAAVPLLQIAAVFQLSDGAQAIAAGALRGAGDTRSPLYANLVGHYAIGVPVALVMGFSMTMGAPGLWWGLSAGLTATAIALIARFLWLSARPIDRV